MRTSMPTDKPEPLDDSIRRRMQLQRRRDTRLEVKIRRVLHRMGYRFRVDYRPDKSLRCRGDLVFTRLKVVVFVDGCFWHGQGVLLAADLHQGRGARTRS